MAGFAAVAPLAAQVNVAGRVVYENHCVGCHGEAGDGAGDAVPPLLPRPRDFARGVYKIRSTPTGELPTDADLDRVVAEGMPGSAMPAWNTKLSEAQRKDVVAYVKTLSAAFAGPPAQAIALGKAPAVSAAGVSEGRLVYEKLQCSECHGAAGRGDGPSAPTLKDDRGFPIRATDLTKNWAFRGGAAVEQIYTRLRTGMDGTPMPSYADAAKSRGVTDEQLWRVAQYVQSLSPGRPAAPSAMLHVRAVSGALPGTPGDPAWDRVESHYLPLAGQIIVKPRWFTPSVDGLWLQATHDGKQLALKLTWHDPSRSPDPAFDAWVARLAQAVPDVDGPVPAAQGPDRVTVVFPTRLQPDSVRPSFVGGDTRLPAYAWRWASLPDSAEEGTARGPTRFARRAAPGQVRRAARFSQGEWQLQLTRALKPSDTTATTFVAGQALPIAFFVADGSNGELGGRGALSGWYVLHLESVATQAVQ